MMVVMTTVLMVIPWATSMRDKVFEGLISDMPGGNCVKTFVRCIDGGKACSKVEPCPQYLLVRMVLISLPLTM